MRTGRRGLFTTVALLCWGATGLAVSPQAQETLVAPGTGWRYLKGTAEASSPSDAWRFPGFDDSGWAAGPAPIHYGSNAVGGDDGVTTGTILGDMRYNYTSVFLRHVFVANNVAAAQSASMTVNYDDGFVAWINGVEVARANVSGNPAAGNVATASHEADPAVVFALPAPPSAYLAEGTNVLAVQAFNRSLTASTDFRFETDLQAVFPDPIPPTVLDITPYPGATLGALAEIAVTFSEPVVGVDASDLLLDDMPAASVGADAGGAGYVFGFPAVPPGVIPVAWDPAAGIADLSGNPFAATNRWQYLVTDGQAPIVTERRPAAGAEVGTFTQAQVTFSEPVSGVQAADLQVNGQPAVSVSGLGAGPYLFQFPSPAAGTVALNWAPGHGIQDLAEVPNPFVEAPWTVSLSPATASGSVIINELVAANLHGLTDADGEPQDWIELFNAGSQPVNLLGWSLTDDPDVPGKWVFPSHLLAPGEYLVVYASGKDRRQAPFHTNFKLNVFGEYLALFRPESPWTVADAQNPAFPEQRNDYAYGRDPSGAWRYYAVPTPGVANGTSPVVGVAPPPHFSVARGWYDAPFTLLLTTMQPGAQIRYTLDGTEPTAATGAVYAGPLTIAASTPVRAACFRPAYLPSRTVTHSYLFLDEVPYQSNTPPGYPSTWGTRNNVGFPNNLVPADYEMDLDPLRTNPNDPGSAIDPAKMQRLMDGLRELPVVSMVMDPDDIFGSGGLYPNSMNKDFGEKPVSLEMWLPDGTTAFTIEGGLAMHGNASRNPEKNPKHGYKLSFRGDYGETRLAYRLFPDSPAEDFDDLILRADFGASWRHQSDTPTEGLGAYQRSRASRTRDAYFKQCLRDMGPLASHNRYFHLFINGLYWGTFDFSEQPTAEFAARYFGGATEDYDVYDQGVMRNGTSAAYNEMLAITNLDVPANYEHMKQVLDITEFIDYMLMHFYLGAQDWGYNVNKNWYAIRKRVDGPDGRFRYIPWDGENILLNEDVNRVNDSGYPSGLHTKLVANAEYRLAFADRVFLHLLGPGGALTVPATIQRWQYWQGILDAPIVAESCRWGDYRRDVHPYTSGAYVLYTRENQWQVENNRVTSSYLPNRNALVLSQLRNAGLYPLLDAPLFNQPGGPVAPGFEAILSATAGDIYYTTDGADPRVYGTGAVAPTAARYTGLIPIAGAATIRARANIGAAWSALNQATFTVGSLGLPLRISEIMYNPPGGDAYEYIEVLNAGAIPLDIGRFAFEGIDYFFPEATVLAPGAVLLLSSGAAPNLFRARYPAAPVFGTFGGALANGGERIAILDREGRTVAAVHYDDEGGWPVAADGGGAALEVIDPLGDPNAPANWRAQLQVNGTPGIPPAPPPPPGAVVLNELMAHNLSALPNQGTFPDWVEIHNRGAVPVDLGGWSLTDDSNPRKFVFPAPTPLDPGQLLLVWCDNDVAAPGLHSGFSLDRAGDNLFLYDNQTNRADAISFWGQIADLSIGRIGQQWTLTLPTPLAANQAATLAPADQLTVNEWLANPAPGDADWLELYNRSATAPIALGGLYLSTSNADIRLPSLGFLPPLGHLQLFADEGAGPDHLDFKLPAAGGTIALADATAQELEHIGYGAQSTGVSAGRLPDGTAAIVPFPASPSPGAANYLPAWAGPVLNEVLARNQRAAVSPWGTFADYVELVHPGPSPADLSGMALGQAPDDNDRWMFPPGATLQSGETLVVWCDDSRPPSGAGGPPFNTGFALSGDGDQVVLFNPAGQAVDSVRFGPQLTDRPIGLSSGAWRLLDAATPGTANAAPAALAPATSLRFNEWMADPILGPDWFELYNPAAFPVDLGGLYVTDDPSVTGITKNPIASLSYIDGGRWLAFTADDDPGDGPGHVRFRLEALGETLRLYTAGLALIDAVDYGIQSPGVSQGRLPDGAAAIVSFPDTPSRGDGNYLALTNVVIHEVLTHTDTPLEDAVELYNPTASPVAIGGWYLSDSQADPRRYRIPDGTTIPAGGYRVFYQVQFGPADGETDVPPLFTFNAARGDEVYLVQTDGAGAPTGYRTGRRFGAAANGVSFGRYLTSVGEDFPPLVQPTFGAVNPVDVIAFRAGAGQANAAPRVGPVVINEIMYHPAPADTNDLASADDEYIELHNLSGASVPLYDPAYPANRWRLDNAVAFTFPAGAAIPPGGYLVVVPFDPAADPDALARFQTRYGAGAVLTGPYDGRLDNGGETVELYRPDTPQAPPHPDAGYVPQIQVEWVAYRDAAPWPMEADGGGASLQRDVSAAYGNDPANWRGDAPTPGQVNFSIADAPPIITEPPADASIIAGASVTFAVRATGAPPLAYQWLHDGVAMPGGTATHLDLVAVDPADSGEYRVRVTNAFGVVLSDPPALLTVWSPPVITLQPQGGQALVGSAFTFQTSVAGDTPLLFQWHLDGGILPGASGQDLTLYNLKETDTGSYSLWATNPVGQAWSDPARLTVFRPPALQQLDYTDEYGLQAVLNATAGVEYLVETSSNLVSWTGWIILSQTNNLTPLVDPAADNRPLQFYRVLLPDDGQGPD